MRIIKKIYLFSLLAAFSLNLLCQQSNEMVQDSIYSYGWNPYLNDWVREERQVYTYDAKGNRTQSWSYDWNSEINDWINFRKSVKYWSELTTPISINNIVVYPNPFTEFTTINYFDATQTRKIELLEMNGRIIRTINHFNSNSVTIHRDNLAAGIYFIRIHADDIYVKEVIIR